MLLLALLAAVAGGLLALSMSIAAIDSSSSSLVSGA
jgi:hypothetical protein